MIVTGELVRDLGTSKFIPVIRQKNGSALLPKSVSTRFYINLNEDQNFEEQFEILLRELHQVPAVPKPTIGKSPFALIPSGEEMPVGRSIQGSEITVIDNWEDISSIYKTAITIAREGDIVSWRRIIRQARRHIPDGLSKWRSKYESSIPKTDEGLTSMVLDGLSIYIPLFGIALAGVESGRNKFNDQVSILDEILLPKNWNRSGITLIVNYPETAAFFLQALHGAMCLFTDQLHLAINLVSTRIEYFYDGESKPLWQQPEIIGWPVSLGGNPRLAWTILTNLFDELPLLSELFDSQEEYKESICAYYMALNVLEYVETIASGHEKIFSEERPALEIPIYFLKMDDEIKRRAYQLLIADKEQIKYIWMQRRVDESKIRENWDNWIRICGTWISTAYSDYLFGIRGSVTHKRLVTDVLGD